MSTVRPRAEEATRQWAGAAGGGLLAAVVGGSLLSLTPARALGVSIAVAAVGGLVLFPFAGLVALVSGSQLGGLIDFLAPTYANWFLEAIALLVVIGVVIHSYREPRGKRWGPDVLAFRFAAMFLVVLVVSSLLAENRELALDGLRKLLNLLLLFYLIVRLVRTPRRVEALLLAIVIATAVSSLFAVAGYVTGKPLFTTREALENLGEYGPLRLSGASSNDATAASRALLTGTAVASVLAIRSTRRWLLYGACAVLGLAGTVLTLSRSAGLVMAFAAAWLVLKCRGHRRFPMIVACALLLVVIGLALVPAGLWQRLSLMTEPGADWSLQRRVGYQLIGLDLLTRSPWVGVGPENFRERYLDFEYRAMPGRFLESRDLHNMYLSVAVETGPLGLACFGGILVAALIGVRRARRHSTDPEARGFAEAVEFSYVLLLFTALVGAVETSKFLWILMGLAVSMDGIARRASADRFAPAPELALATVG